MSQDNLDDTPVCRKEAANFLTSRGYGVSAATLAKLATVGGGPVFTKFGRRPLYTRSALLNWAKSKTTPPRQSTSG